MKTLHSSITAVALILGLCPAAFAATREDNSGFLVWAFIVVCVAVVVAQLVPALLMVAGIAKGLKKDKDAVSEASSN